ncbi:MAG TPA: metal-dependent hydrolase [Vicinamibacterales bacterium]|jgi:membrane-bound metal-dependent hydrolase YbcI (DUF457 family)
MPSPVGHALAGVATIWTLTPRASRRLLAVAATLAALPDADLVHHGWHRVFTHSIGAVIVVTIIAAAVTGWVNRKQGGASRSPNGLTSPISVALICGAAYASHLLLDWLAADYYAPYGIRALWPFDDGWYISGFDIFRQTARRQMLTWPVFVQNVQAITLEIAILGPILYLLWLVRVKPATRLASELTGAHHPAE